MQSVERQDQFGAAHDTLKYYPPSTHKSNGPPRLDAYLGEYFDTLAVAATTEKGLLEELVQENATLTATNAEMLAAVAILIKSSEKLSRRVGNLHKNCT